jgi:hypothetical protein
MFADEDRYMKAGEMYERALAGREKALGPEHMSTIRLAQRLRALRTLLREPTSVDESADYNPAFSEYSNSRLS